MDRDIDGASLIAAERRRQIDAEGWSPEHDRNHGQSVLLKAAHCYRSHPGSEAWQPGTWPWDAAWWKPKDCLSNLIRAGALYQAAADLSGYLTPMSIDLRDQCVREIDKVLARARQVLIPAEQ